MMNALHPLLIVASLCAMAFAQAEPAPFPTAPPGAQTGVVEIQTAPDAAAQTTGPGGRPYMGLAMRLTVAPPMIDAAYLGVGVDPTDYALAAQLKLPEGVGLTVQAVVPGGPADLAGLAMYDVIYKIDDQLAINQDQFQVLIRTHKAGDKVTLTIYRKAQPQTLTATLTLKQQPELSWLSMMEHSWRNNNLQAPSNAVFTGDGSANRPVQVTIPPNGKLIEH